ncbi:MAG: PKD domain-containing protein [Methanobacteriota archaeon]
MSQRFVLLAALVLSVPAFAGCIGAGNDGGDDALAPTGIDAGRLAEVAPGVPVATFTVAPTAGDASTLFSFDASRSKDADGGALTFAWNFGDGATAAGEKATHQYTITDSVVSVVLSATDEEGMTGVAVQTITLGAGARTEPTVGMSRLAKNWVAVDDPIAVEATASDPDGEGLSYLWTYAPLANAAAAGGDGGHGAHGGHQHDAGPSAIESGDLTLAKQFEVTFDAAGVYGFHCHPHPYMKHSVTVSDAPGALSGTVDVVQKDYAFHPASIVVAPGTKVRYTNADDDVHTVTQESFAKLLPLSAASGTVAIPETGDFMIMVTVTDPSGLAATAFQKVRIARELPPETVRENFTGEFPLGDATLYPPKEHRFVLDYPAAAKVTLTWTDTPAALNKIHANLFAGESGGTALTVIAGEPVDIDLAQGAYTLQIVPEQGVQIAYEVVVEAVYTLVAHFGDEAAAGDGHGHAH